MDFSERVFNLSPDGGSGASELLYLVAVFGVGLAYVFRRPWCASSKAPCDSYVKMTPSGFQPHSVVPEHSARAKQPKKFPHALFSR